MKYNVVMLAFVESESVRSVDVPDNEITGSLNNDLSRIYHYGQNNFQPDSSNPSVSVGDVIEYNGERFMVCMSGFKRMSQTDFDHYRSLPRFSDDGSSVDRLSIHIHMQGDDF